MPPTQTCLALATHRHLCYGSHTCFHFQVFQESTRSDLLAPCAGIGEHMTCPGIEPHVRNPKPRANGPIMTIRPKRFLQIFGESLAVDEAEQLFKNLPQYGAPPIQELAEIQRAHDLVPWDPPDPLPDDRRQLCITCRQCWRTQVRYKGYWQRNPTCSTQRALYTWLPNLNEKNKQSLATIWGVTLAQANKFIDGRKGIKKKLAEANFQRFIDQGIQPNPGPFAEEPGHLRNICL